MEWTPRTLMIDPDADLVRLGPDPGKAVPKRAAVHTAPDGYTILARLHGGGAGMVQMGSRIVRAGAPGAEPYRVLVTVYPPGGGLDDEPADRSELQPSRYPTMPEISGAIHAVAPRGAMMALPPIVSSGDPRAWNPPELGNGGTITIELRQVGAVSEPGTILEA